LINNIGTVASLITLEVVGVGGEVRTLQFSNIMTNFGLDSWTKGILGTHIALGSGSRTEVVTVTDLAGFVRTQSGSYTYTNTNFIDEVRGVMRSDLILNVVFPIETVAQNYSEMGIHNNNRNELQTYARIRDAVGDPTSVGIQVGEQVRVSYAVQYSTPLSSVSTQTIGANVTTVTTVPLATGATNNIRLPDPPTSAGRLWPAGQGIPVAGVAPVGGVAPPRASVISNGQYSMGVQLTELNLVGGIALIRMGGTSNSVGLMCHFDPPIAKNAGNAMTVTVTTNLMNGEFYA
jgi:hypothetical protein